jgi:hypothetical protein
MQPPASHRHKCKTTQGKSSGFLMFGN